MIAGKAETLMQEQMMKIDGHAMELSPRTGEMDVQGPELSGIVPTFNERNNV